MQLILQSGTIAGVFAGNWIQTKGSTSTSDWESMVIPFTVLVDIFIPIVL